MTNNNEIGIDDLIIITKTINEFNVFINNIKSFLINNKNNQEIYKLGKVARGEFCFNSKKSKQFYKDNKNVIDIINQHSYIVYFILSNFTNEGNLKDNSSIAYYYNYLLRNRNNIDSILKLLEKIKKLGIRKLVLDETLDFTEKTYVVNKYLSYNYSCVFLDNMEVVPTYGNSEIKYKTTGSNYEIAINNSIISNRSNMRVNSLVFEPSHLPRSLDKEDTYDVILILKKETKTNDILTKIIDLSIEMDELDKNETRIEKLVDKLYEVDSKLEIKELLNKIRPLIEELSNKTNNYNNNMIEKYKDITNERINKEKKLELNRRQNSWIDFD